MGEIGGLTGELANGDDTDLAWAEYTSEGVLTRIKDSWGTGGCFSEPLREGVGVPLLSVLKGARGTELALGMERDVRGVLVRVSRLDLSSSAGLVGLRRRNG